MKVVLMLLIAGLCLGVAQGVLPEGWELDPNIQRIITTGSTCDRNIFLSLSNVILPRNESFSALCESTTFFSGCRDDYTKRCTESNNCKPAEAYMKWIDAYTVAGRKYTCSLKYESIVDVFQNQGGYSCFSSQIANETSAYTALLTYLKDPQSVGCGNMENLINNVLNPLEMCKNALAYYNMTLGYFEAVVKGSPCAGKINLRGTGNNAMANTLLLISSFLIFSAISFIS